MVDIEDDPVIDLSIPLKPIVEEFTCPICYGIIKSCFITPCGHAFCEECIKECLNRKHQCPCCNQKTTIQELARNKHADRLISIIVTEKDKASKAYFEQLITGGIKPDTQSNNGGNGNGSSLAPLSPIESVFHKYMHKSLHAYEDYYKKLKQKYETGVEELKKSLTDQVVKASNEKKSELVAKLKSDYEAKVNEMKAIFEKSESMLLQSYEQFLKDAVITPQFLPVQLFVTVECKEGLRFPLVVKPTENAKDVREYIKQHCENMGDPIVKFGKKTYFILKSSYVAKLGDESSSSKSQKKHNRDAEIVIKDEDIPIRQYDPEPGSVLVLHGKVKFKSDAPKVCFKSVFEKDKGMLCDYYTCHECKIKWICKSCMEVCHQGHTTSEYLLQHKSTWACCYCVKTRKCKLYSKDSKGK